MADIDPKVIALNSSNSRLRQTAINLERNLRKLKNENKKLVKQIKALTDENKRLKRKLAEFEKKSRNS